MKSSFSFTRRHPWSGLVAEETGSEGLDWKASALAGATGPRSNNLLHLGWACGPLPYNPIQMRCRGLGTHCHILAHCIAGPRDSEYGRSPPSSTIAFVEAGPIEGREGGREGGGGAGSDGVRGGTTNRGEEKGALFFLMKKNCDKDWMLNRSPTAVGK